ncbi:hypothetical protein J6590_097686 [Homalodisca vitripennis]|nr:hypothetical protein J6590_097686 [Homalodisca vitripennis]
MVAIGGEIFLYQNIPLLFGVTEAENMTVTETTLPDITCLGVYNWVRRLLLDKRIEQRRVRLLFGLLTAERFCPRKPPVGSPELTFKPLVTWLRVGRAI